LGVIEEKMLLKREGGFIDFEDTGVILCANIKVVYIG